jgi:hypothetical protein
MLGVGAALMKSLNFAGDSDNRSQAIYLAEAQLTNFLGMATNDAALAGCGPPNGCNDPTNPLIIAEDTVAPGVSPNAAGVGERVNFNRSWTIEQNTPMAGVRRISVTVSWVGSTVDNSVTLVGFK